MLVASRALAGLGLVGSLSMATLPLSAGTAVFSDGFERGNMSAWSAVRGISAQQAFAHSGSWAARARSTGRPAYAVKKLADAYTGVEVRLASRVLSQGTRAPLVTVRSANGRAVAGLQVTAGGRLALRNHLRDVNFVSPRRVTDGWHQLRLRVLVAGSRSWATTWLDGAVVSALSRSLRLGGGQLGQIRLGDAVGGRRFDVVVDDVAARRVGDDTSAPSLPRNLNAAVGFSGRVRLSWKKSSDDVAVSGYDILRNGKRLAAAGTRTSYTDTSAELSRRYDYVVRARDAAGNRSWPSVAATVSMPDPVVAAAGDIACDPAHPHFNGGEGTDRWCQQKATSDLLVGSGVDRVLALGDTQYEEGTLATFRRSYDPSWGRVKARTSPVAGNHEYRTVGAAGYFSYFGAAAGDRKKGYYSYNLGKWHLIALNSQCPRLPRGDGASGCSEASPQNNWLEADLAAHRTQCTLAYWHKPPNFNATADDNAADLLALWRDLYAAGTELVLTGHHHFYSRYAPRDVDGHIDRARGVRLFIVGTGGKNLGAASEQTPPTVEVRNNTTFGVLRLSLQPGQYQWKFVPTVAGGFTDSGSTSCH